MVIAFFKHHKNFGLDPSESVYAYLITVIFFTLVEYHLIERFLVTKIKTHFSENARERIGINAGNAIR